MTWATPSPWCQWRRQALGLAGSDYLNGGANNTLYGGLGRLLHPLAGNDTRGRVRRRRYRPDLQQPRHHHPARQRRENLSSTVTVLVARSPATHQSSPASAMRWTTPSGAGIPTTCCKAWTAMTTSLAATANDKLEGGNGDDYLDGGTGTNKLIGGAGNEHLPGDRHAQTTITEAADGGFDTMVSYDANFTMPKNVEALRYDGTSHFQAWGSDSNNSISGSKTGTNYLKGGAGNDLLMAAPTTTTSTAMKATTPPCKAAPVTTSTTSTAPATRSSSWPVAAPTTTSHRAGDLPDGRQRRSRLPDGRRQPHGLRQRRKNVMYGNDGVDTLFGMNGDDARSWVAPAMTSCTAATAATPWCGDTSNDTLHGGAGTTASTAVTATTRSAAAWQRHPAGRGEAGTSSSSASTSPAPAAPSTASSGARTRSTSAVRRQPRRGGRPAWPSQPMASWSVVVRQLLCREDHGRHGWKYTTCMSTSPATGGDRHHARGLGLPQPLAERLRDVTRAVEQMKPGLEPAKPWPCNTAGRIIPEGRHAHPAPRSHARCNCASNRHHAGPFLPSSAWR